MMERNKPIYTALDIGKFLCALLILFYHYFTEHKVLPSLLEEALSLYAVAVALFMTISGFLTFDKLSGMTETAQRWSYVVKQVKRILLIYALWSIPYLVYTIADWDWGHLTLNFVLWQFQHWIFGSTFYTIWFMPVLAVGLVVTFWLSEKLPKIVVALLAVISYFIGTLMMTYSFVGNSIPGFEVIRNFSDTWLGGGRGWLFFAFPLLLVGKAMVEIKRKMTWQKMLPAALFSMVALLGEALLLRRFAGNTGVDMTLTMPLTVFCILGFLLGMRIPGRAYSLWMRRMSVLIFMTQRLFLTVMPALLPAAAAQTLFANGYLGAVVVCGGTIAFSALIIALSAKVLWLKKLY